MDYTIMLIYIVLLCIISIYVINSYKPQAFCLEKDILIDSKEIKKVKKNKRRYFKPKDRVFASKLLLNYTVVIVALVTLFTIYLSSGYFFGYKSFLELFSGKEFDLIIDFIFFLVMIFSPILAILITVRTLILLIEAYTTTIKLEKNHLVFNNKFRTINIFFNKDKHKVFLEKGYIKGILGQRSNITYYKLIFDFKNEKRELKLYGFNENDAIALKNHILS